MDLQPPTDLSKMSDPDRNREGLNKYVQRARVVLALLGGMYLLTVVFLSIPFLQTQLVISLPANAVFILMAIMVDQCLVLESLTIPFLRDV